MYQCPQCKAYSLKPINLFYPNGEDDYDEEYTGEWVCEECGAQYQDIKGKLVMSDNGETLTSAIETNLNMQQFVYNSIINA